MLNYNKGLLLKFKNTFLRVPDAERRWYDIIIWWEIRRVLYNLIIVPAGLFWLGILVLMLVLHSGEGEDLGDPFLPIFFVFTYIIVANIFYTFGWISEIVGRGSRPGNRSPAPDVFISGSIISAGFALLIPPVITILFILILVLVKIFS